MAARQFATQSDGQKSKEQGEKKASQNYSGVPGAVEFSRRNPDSSTSARGLGLSRRTIMARVLLLVVCTCAMVSICMIASYDSTTGQWKLPEVEFSINDILAWSDQKVESIFIGDRAKRAEEVIAERVDDDAIPLDGKDTALPITPAAFKELMNKVRSKADINIDTNSRSSGAKDLVGTEASKDRGSGSSSQSAALVKELSDEAVSAGIHTPSGPDKHDQIQ